MAKLESVLIVGAGVAGMVAACRASELGLSVIVLEKSPDEDYMCNSRLTGGVFHVGMDNIFLPPAELREIIARATHGEAKSELAEALADNAGRVVAWLRSQGIKFIKGGPTPDMSAVLSPPKLAQFGAHWKGRSGDVFLRTLAERLAQRGAVIRRGVCAQELIMDDRRCIGVLARTSQGEERLGASAVVLADGGFQANNELVKRSISPAPEKIFQRNAKSGTGDGLRMAEQVGAQLVGLNRFYGHMLHRDAFSNDNLWPYPMLDVLALAGIVVDHDGRRFVDEGRGGVYITNEIAMLSDPCSSTVIVDDAIWNGPGKEWILSPNPNIAAAGGAILTAPDLDRLASMAQISPEGLKLTVAQYNAALDCAGAARLSPPRTIRPHVALPIKVPPFHAIPACAGITYTMGGIAIDREARVLGTDGQVIEGLFAAGSTTGGLEGGTFVGYTGGLSKAATFGLLAAECIARSAQS